MAGFKKNKLVPEFKTFLNEKKNQTSNYEENLNFSFEDFCPKQQYACSFLDWQKGGLLARAMDTLHGYCKSPISYDGDKFGLYGDFPKQGYTLFSHPDHVTPDAKWVKMHISGTGVLVGHVVRNTFYIVFLDKSHAFYLTKRNREKYFGSKK